MRESSPPDAAFASGSGGASGPAREPELDPLGAGGSGLAERLERDLDDGARHAELVELPLRSPSASRAGRRVPPGGDHRRPVAGYRSAAVGRLPSSSASRSSAPSSSASRADGLVA